MRRLGAIGLALMAVALGSGCATGLPGTPTYVTDISATVNGIVATSHGGSVSYWVEYGTSTSYGSQSTHRSQVAAAESAFRVSVPIAGLTPGRTYHYRICGHDSQPGVGAHCGPDATLETAVQAGRSGIAFSSNRGPGEDGSEFDVIVMGSDGSNPTNLTESASSGEGLPTWSPDARRFAYMSLIFTPELGVHNIWAMNADGSDQHALTSGITSHLYPAWSPDGRSIAYNVIGGDYDIYVMDADGTRQRSLTRNDFDDVEPAWSPDGAQIVFAAAPGQGRSDIFVMNADGSDRRQLTATAETESSPAWSPDGTKIAFTREINGDDDVFVMNADGGNPVNVSSVARDEFSPTWSPDGTKIAFTQGNADIFVMSASGASPVNLTNDAFVGDWNPVWSPRP
jgi:dipeptidyl aminopeptidase/acylaminoacyl peptidase